MASLVFRSWCLLAYLEVILRLRDFRTLYALVGSQIVQTAPAYGKTADDVCRAIDLACVFYFKPVLCLQRSAAAALLLRRFGFPAEMIIGVQMLPFRSHAWVEVEGIPVNDKPYMREIYQVFDRS